MIIEDDEHDFSHITTVNREEIDMKNKRISENIRFNNRLTDNIILKKKGSGEDYDENEI